MDTINYNDVIKSVALMVEQFICLECCHIYVLPTTSAKCGHMLCKNCWIGRQSCPECSQKVDKTQLMLNKTVNAITKILGGLRLDVESFLEIDVNEVTEFNEDICPKKPATARVEDWLKDSQNQFSAPISQDSTQDIGSPVKVVSHVQVHEKLKNKPGPVMKTVVSKPPQDDYDKIEVLPELENKDPRENVVGPMDLEPFELDEEYTNKNPRRSLRKRQNSFSDNSKENIKSKALNSSTDTDKKQDKYKTSTDSTKDTDKKQDKSKQNWAEVKKMKKEFSKLSNSKAKLNVSIEKCKRSNSKQTSITNLKKIPTESQDQILIDDNTPNIIPDRNNVKKNVPSKDIEKNMVADNVDTAKVEVSMSKDNAAINYENKIPDDINRIPVTFVKKSTLLQKKSVESNQNDESDPAQQHPTPTENNNNTSSNEISYRDDNVYITIKFRGMETYFNLKTNDDLNDQGVQTNPITVIQKKAGATGNTVHIDTQTHIPGTSEPCIKHYKSQLVQTSQSCSKCNKVTHSVGVQTDQSELKQSNDKIQTQSHTSKLSKKNTDSAETATANYEITETIAKELSVIMECEENDNLGNSKTEKCVSKSIKKINSSQKTAIPLVSQHSRKMSSQAEEIDDVDIFNSGSVKERSVHKLKDVKNAQSEIIMTHKSNRSRTRNSDKRSRDPCDESKTVSKKQKVSQDIMQNTSGTNYDELMGQVFANIDVDLEKNTENVDKNTDPKYSENIFSLAEKESQGQHALEKDKNLQREMTQEDIDNLLTPGMCEDLVAHDEQLQPAEEVVCTPLIDDDDRSVVEETPQKSVSFNKPKSRDSKSSGESRKYSVQSQLSKRTNRASADRVEIKQTLDSPMTLNTFVNQIEHKSTPVARKNLDFSKNTENIDDDNVTLCPSLTLAKTTQERALMTEAFNMPQSQVRKPLSPKNVVAKKQYCIAGSCLHPSELSNLKILCHKKKWTFADKYSAALTHLIVGVDEDRKSQRSVKYMCALAAGCWILSPQWVKRCLETNAIVNEEPFEVLDTNGEPGPRRSRLAKKKIFTTFKFFCMPPFNVLDPDTLKWILEVSGGRVVDDIDELKDPETPALLLAEPDNTEDPRFMYMAANKHIVPVNFEWVLNCLGSYTLLSLSSLLLCPFAVLPECIQKWPSELFASDDD